MPTVLITGANRGIGLEFVKQYGSDQWRVIACCRNPQKADALQSLVKINPTIQIEALDVSLDQNISDLAHKLKDIPLDLLVNNAGISERGDLRRNIGTMVSETWMETFRVNAVAPIMVTQAFLPHLKQGQVKKVAMISSIRGSLENTGNDGTMAYRSSKAALNMAMRSASFTLKSEGIVFVSLHPGWVKTDMGGNAASLTPQQSVMAMRHTIAELGYEKSGQFLNYDGTSLPW